MLPKSGVFALVAMLTAGAHALTLNTPSNVQSGRNITVTWTAASGDQPFTLYLHHPSFNSDFAVANNVDPTTGSITFQLPEVTPRDNQYTFRAANITDINQQYSVSSAFAVGDPSGTGASGSGAAGGTGTATSPPPTGTGTATGTGAGTVTGSGVTTATGTSAGTGTGTARGNVTGTSTGAGSDTTSGGNGAVSMTASVGAIGLAVLGLFAML
jgi:hypothetical protein